MNCYNHSTESGVGICKHCNKALCHECATDTGEGIACTDTCVAIVNDLNRLINRNKRTVSTQQKSAYLTPAFLGVMGAIFLVFGLSGVQNAPLPIAMGVGLLLFALLNAIKVKKWLSNDVT